MDNRLKVSKDSLFGKRDDMPLYISYTLSLYNNNYLEAEYFLSYGFDPNMIIDVKGLDLSTPFIDTLRRKYLILARKMLTAYNANVDFKYFASKNPLVLYELLSVCDLEWMIIITDNMKKLNVVPYQVKKEWLYYAVEDGNLELCDFLIASGVYPHELSETHGETLLQVAVFNGYFKLAQHLLKFKSNLKIKNNKKENILHLCFSKMSSPSAKYRIFHSNLFCKMLLEYCFKSKKCHKNGHDSLTELLGAPLPITADHAAKEKLEFILNFPVVNELVNDRDLSGMTPLHLAVMREELEIIKYFLKMGADPNIEDFDKRTPIYFFSLKKTLSVLLRNGAEHCVYDINSDTPLEFFINKGNFFSSSSFVSAIQKPAFNLFKANELIFNGIKSGVIDTETFKYVIDTAKHKDPSFSLSDKIILSIFKYTPLYSLTKLLTLFLNYDAPIDHFLNNARYYIKLLFIRYHKEYKNSVCGVCNITLNILYNYIKNKKSNEAKLANLIWVCAAYDCHLEGPKSYVTMVFKRI